MKLPINLCHRRAGATHVASSARTIPRRAGIAALAVLLTPWTAGACPVCFGAAEGPVASGLNTAVLFMIGVTTVVLVAIGSFAWRLARLARRPRVGQVPGPVATGAAPSPAEAAC